MLLGARTAAWSGGLSAKSYVQDGLVAMWDGIENAGWGTHDASATTWKDLIGSEDFTRQAGGTFSDNSLVMNANNGIAASRSSFSISQPTLIEAVYKIDSVKTTSGSSILLHIPQWHTGNSMHRCIIFSGSAICYISCGNNVYLNRIGNLTIGEYNFDSVLYGGDVSISSSYKNGAATTPTKASDYWFYNDANPIVIGNRADKNRGVSGDFYCLRFYSKDIGLNARLANYAVDVERFGLT